MDTELLGRSRFLNHYFEISGLLVEAHSRERLSAAPAFKEKGVYPLWRQEADERP